MTDNIRIMSGAMLGAIAGGLAAHLLLTDRGRYTLSRIRPALEDLSRGLDEVCTTLEKVGEAIREGRRVTREVRSSTADFHLRAR